MNAMKPPEPSRVHYWLVSGSVVVMNDDNISALPQNAMITTDFQQIGEHQLGKAQQALQVTLFRKMGEAIKVVDVILHNLVYLGQMTPEEFHAKPAGVDVQPVEKPQGGAEVIDFTEALQDR